MEQSIEVETVTFDSYTTIVDVDSQAEFLKNQVSGMTDADAISRF